MYVVFLLFFFFFPARRHLTAHSRDWPRKSLLAAIVIFSNGSLWQPYEGNIGKLTLVDMAMNNDLINFGVSRTNSIAPPQVQKLNIEMVITPEPLVLEK